MAKFWKTVFENLKPEKSQHSIEIERVKVKHNIVEVLEEYLKEPDTVLKFEVTTSSDLAYALEVISDDDITSLYDVQQVSETVFIAKQRSIEL